MDGHDRKHGLVNNCPNCDDIGAEKDVEGPRSVCGSEVWHEETSPKRSRRFEERNAQEDRENMIENSPTCGIGVRLSNDPDYPSSNSDGNTQPGSNSAMDTFKVDDVRRSNSFRHAPRVKSYNDKNQGMSAEDDRDDDRVNSSEDSWRQQDYNDDVFNDHSGSSLVHRDKNYDKRQRKKGGRKNRSHYSSRHGSMGIYDQNSSLGGHASHSLGDDLMERSMDDYRHDDYPSSSRAGHSSPSLMRSRDDYGRDDHPSSTEGHGLVAKSKDDYRCHDHPSASSAEGHGLVAKSKDDYRRHDHPSSSPAEGHGLVARYKDGYRHDDHPCSSAAGHSSPVKGDHGNQGRSKGYIKSNNRNQNMITNERKSRRRRVQHQDEFLNISPSTGTAITAGRDEPFDICSMPKTITSMELSTPLETAENYMNIQNLMPGMFLLKKWLTKTQQIKLVQTCRELGVGEGGFFQPSFDKGRKLHLWMMCLGKNWNHRRYKYEEIRAHDHAHPPPIPADFVPLVHKAIEAAHNELKKNNNLTTQQELNESLPGLDPDVCIVNYYEESGKLGIHQDKDESKESIEKGLPVVSFSIGDSAEFRYGNENRSDKLDSIILESGDVLIFGGKSRLVFHGVSELEPGTAPDWLTQNTGLLPGRLNLTFRQI